MTELNTKNFDESIQNSNYVVVDFYADWCPPCKIVQPVLESLSEEMEDVNFYKINVDNNSEIANKFKIMSIPTIVYFKNGEYFAHTIGASNKKQIKDKIKSIFNL